MEKDIIILATTVTHGGAFACDVQRVNVAFTRARHHLLVVGCSSVLRSCSPAFRLLLAGCPHIPAAGGLLIRAACRSEEQRTGFLTSEEQAGPEECVTAPAKPISPHGEAETPPVVNAPSYGRLIPSLDAEEMPEQQLPQHRLPRDTHLNGLSSPGECHALQVRSHRAAASTAAVMQCV